MENESRQVIVLHEIKPMFLIFIIVLLNKIRLDQPPNLIAWILTLI